MFFFVNRSGIARIPFFRFTLVLIGGIITAKRWDKGYAVGCWIYGSLVVSYGVLLLLQRKKKWLDISSWLGFVGLSALFMVGYVRSLQQNPARDTHHFMHVLDKIDAYKGVVVSEVDRRSFSDEAIVAVKEVLLGDSWCSVRGKVRLCVARKKGLKLVYGAVVLVQKKPSALGGPSNPYVPDYNGKWLVQGVFHTHTTKNLDIKAYTCPNEVMNYVFVARDHVRQWMKSYTQNQATQGILLSLLLGDRSELSSEQRNVYVAAGVMHVLAVSGLHIGLLYTFILAVLYLLSWMLGRPKKYHFLSLFFLWGYALMIGMPPSVMRAVGMLSLIVVSRWVQRDYQAVNGLSLLAFFFLLYNPYLLFDLSFQFSFVAVLSIITFYLPIVSCYSPRGRYMRYWWKMTAVSLAAQVGTLPISVYYFHYFPTYFLLANWVMIPVVTLWLTVGCCLVLCLWKPWVLERSVMFTTNYLNYIRSLPAAQLGPFWIDGTEVAIYYALLFTLYIGIKQRRFHYMCLGTLLVCMLSGKTIHREVRRQRQEEIIVYDVSPHAVIGLVRGKEATLVRDRVLQPYNGYYKYAIKPSLEALGITHIHQCGLSAPLFQEREGVYLFQWHNKGIVIMNKESKATDMKYDFPYSIDLCIVEGASLAVIKSWLACYKVEMLVIGNTTKNPYKIVEEAIKHSIPYHLVSKKGAWHTHV